MRSKKKRLPAGTPEQTDDLFNQIAALRRKIKPLPKGETTKRLIEAGRSSTPRKSS